MNKINVLYSFPLRLGTPGTGMTAWHQVTGLLRQGIRVQLYTGSCEKEINGLNSLKETLVPYGIKLPIRLIRLLRMKRAVELHDKAVAKAIRRIHSEIDIVHCWPSGAKETLKTSREFGIKTVLERPNTHTRYACEVVGQECAKLGMKLPKSHSHVFDAYRLRRQKEEFDLADRLLCPSQFVAKTFLDMGFKKEKIALHQYGFDPSRFNFSPNNPSTNNWQPFRIVFLGSCEPRKGLHYALQAWLGSVACNEGRFYICGNFVPKYRKLLANMLIHPSIRYIGFIDDVTTILRRCHALILPTVEEGSSLVTYEARACGCVLLVSEASGARSTHMHDSLVHKVGDVASLRDHINLLASNQSFYKKLRKNSLAGLDQLTWEKASEILVDIYYETLGLSSK